MSKKLIKIPNEFQIPYSNLISIPMEVKDSKLEYLMAAWSGKHCKILPKKQLFKEEAELLQKEALKMYYKTMEDYITRYQKKYPVCTMEELNEMNCIDVSFLNMKKNKNLNEVIRRNGLNGYFEKEIDFYSCIPCFSKGVLKIDEDNYFYFEVLNLDTENEIIDLKLEDYKFISFNPKKKNNDFLEKSSSLKVQFKMEEGDLVETIKNRTNLVEKYTQLTPKELNWGKDEISFWEEVILQYAVISEREWKYKKNSPEKSILRIYFAGISLANYLLEQKKPVVVKNDKKKSMSKPVYHSGQENSSKKIRKVGIIQFVSEYPPKKVDKNNIRHYYTEQWGVRGHIRRYKNGKTVYIKPTIRHRKKMQNKETKIRNQTIQFVDNSKKTH